MFLQIYSFCHSIFSTQAKISRWTTNISRKCLWSQCSGFYFDLFVLSFVLVFSVLLVLYDSSACKVHSLNRNKIKAFCKFMHKHRKYFGLVISCIRRYKVLVSEKSVLVSYTLKCYSATSWYLECLLYVNYCLLYPCKHTHKIF